MKKRSLNWKAGFPTAWSPVSGADRTRWGCSIRSSAAECGWWASRPGVWALPPALTVPPSQLARRVYSTGHTRTSSRTVRVRCWKPTRSLLASTIRESDPSTLTSRTPVCGVRVGHRRGSGGRHGSAVPHRGNHPGPGAGTCPRLDLRERRSLAGLTVVLCLSGRGDKDVDQVAAWRLQS